MRIDRQKDGAVVILAFEGELDAPQLSNLKEKLDETLGAAPEKVILNLARLEFINSSALGLLIKAHKQAREQEGEIVLSSPSSFFKSTVLTLGLDRIFKIFPSDEEAMRYFEDHGGEREVFEDGIPVDEHLLGSTEMSFRLLDAPQAGTAVGKILSLYEDGPTFKYPVDAERIKIDPAELTIGRKLWIRFRQPFLDRERYFEMEAEIALAVDLEDPPGAAKFRLHYTKVRPEDREVLEGFVHDQDLIRSKGRPKLPE